VLPNMDDIAFFESSKYQHRGGIWADASRQEHSSDLFPTPPDTPEDDHLPSSAPVSDAPTPLATDLEPVEMHRSQSAPLEAQPNADSVAESLATSIPVSRATTVSTSSGSSNTSSRRRTWFGSPSDESSMPSGPTNNQELPEAIERGRTGAPDSVGNRRSSSTPNTAPNSLRPDTQGLSEDVDSSDAHPPASSARRSSSQHSSSTSSHEAPSQDTPTPGTSTSPAESLLAGFRSKSPGQSVSTSSKNLPASPTAKFFQTLKTRDKQAISNSAKEAMRKWGVNWGGLKKDNQTSGDEAADGEMRARQNEPNIHRPRPSYAEVRAAVEQRRTTNNEGGLFLASGSEPSEPVDIPYRGKGRTTSMSSFSGPGSTSGQSVGDMSSASTSPRPDRLTPESSSRPRSTSPSLTALGVRQRTTSHHSQSGTDAPVEEDEQPARPIYTQPPAPKAMTIPGIHASHRGEVMSMGYAPPQPLPSEPKKAPAIQSVYRLWKNPGAQHATQSDPQVQSDSTGQEQDTGVSLAGPTMQTPTPTPPARPVPPPLPPRSNSTHAVQLLSEPPLHPPELTSSPPASAALQSIVSKDRTRRESLEKSALPASSTSGRPVPPIPTNTDSNTTNDSAAPPPTPPRTPGAGDGNVSKPKPPALPPRRTPAAAA
jgi:hypothetical protein